MNPSEHLQPYGLRRFGDPSPGILPDAGHHKMAATVAKIKRICVTSVVMYLIYVALTEPVRDLFRMLDGVAELHQESGESRVFPVTGLGISCFGVFTSVVGTLSDILLRSNLDCHQKTAALLDIWLWCCALAFAAAYMEFITVLVAVMYPTQAVSHYYPTLINGSVYVYNHLWQQAILALVVNVVLSSVRLWFMYQMIQIKSTFRAARDRDRDRSLISS